MNLPPPRDLADLCLLELLAAQTLAEQLRHRCRLQLSQSRDGPFLKNHRLLKSVEYASDAILFFDRREGDRELLEARSRQVGAGGPVADAAVEPEMEEGRPEPVHDKGRGDRRRAGPEAVQVVLVETSVDLAVPQGGAADLASFTDEEIAWLQGQLDHFVWIEIHLIERGQIETTPENICGAEERTWGESRACRRRESLSLLDFEDVADPPHAPALRQAADLG